MATIQLGNTKVANRLITYVEKRAVEREGVNCPGEYAKSQMKATRELWGKNNGVQAHHVIQSFKPNEVTPQQANEIGQKLAKEIAPKHEAVVYTHADKDHIHNHIVINSVSHEDGSKYQSSKKDLYNIREKSDDLCRERGLSVVEEKTANVRYTLSEKAILEKGGTSWKDEIRESIDKTKETAKDFDDFKMQLKENYGIEAKERGKNITYTNGEGQKVRGNKLGKDYEKGEIEHGFKRQAEFERTTSNDGQDRGNGDLQNGQRDQARDGSSRVQHEIESSRGVSFDTSQRGNAERNGDNVRTRADQSSEPTTTKSDDFNLDDFNKKLAERQRGLKEGHRYQHQQYGQHDQKVAEGTGNKQNDDREKIERDRAEQQKRNEQSKSQSYELDR